MKHGRILERNFARMLCFLPCYRSLRMCKYALCTFVLLNVAFFSSAKAQKLTYTLRPNDSVGVTLSPVLIGAKSVEDTLYIRDTLEVNDTIRISYSGDSELVPMDSIFVIDSASHPYPFVVTIKPLSSPSSFTGLATIRFHGDSARVTLFSSGIAPTKDSSSILLSNIAYSTIALKYTKDSANVLFFIKNNQEQTDTITNLTTEGNTFFHILGHPSFPIVLAFGDSLPIHISFKSIGPIERFVRDRLYITMPDHPILPSISLQGLYTPDASILETSNNEPTHFWVYPNPSSGPVRIHSDFVHTHFQLTNVLGEILDNEDFTGDWMWDRRASGNYTVPHGTYFLILTGEDANGHTVRQVCPIVLE